MSADIYRRFTSPADNSQLIALICVAWGATMATRCLSSLHTLGPSSFLQRRHSSVLYRYICGYRLLPYDSILRALKYVYSIIWLQIHNPALITSNSLILCFPWIKQTVLEKGSLNFLVHSYHHDLFIPPLNGCYNSIMSNPE